MSQIWDGSSLSDADRYMTEVRYSGAEINSRMCICSASLTSNHLLASLSVNLKKVGSFVLSLFRVASPVDYANGLNSQRERMRDVSYDVFRTDDSLFSVILLGSADKISQNELVKCVIDTVRTEEFIVLDSIRESYYVGNGGAPKLLMFGADGNGIEKLAQPNVISGLSAGISIFSEINHISCKVAIVIEEDFGATKESLRLWAQYIKSRGLDFDIDNVVLSADRINEDNQSFLNHLYT